MVRGKGLVESVAGNTENVNSYLIEIYKIQRKICIRARSTLEMLKNAMPCKKQSALSHSKYNGVISF